MLTKTDLLRLGEPLEAVYMRISSQIIINIARHLRAGVFMSSDRWRLQKLSELSAVTDETMEIIAANTGRNAEIIKKTFREAFGIGIADTEKVLQAAAKAGVIDSAPSIDDSLAMQRLLQAYIGQAEETTNLVNTVMLNSTMQRYLWCVDDVTRIEALQSAKGVDALTEQLNYTQGVLNVSSGQVVTGIESRQAAVRQAIEALADKGITGWIDKGGHQWTAEAYINMDIRTTAHNVAIEAQKQRSAEYGVSTFQISTHAAARPLCAPYQGWICSWDNVGGVVHDLYGKEYQVHGINETSYGEAAGIFGINCGHFPETFVDGYSIPRYEELTPEQEKQNAIDYAESQQQREIEREIRQAKTEALAMQAAGEKEGFEQASLKVKKTQAEYRDFCEKTGRTPRNDRTQVYGYNRSTAGKVNAAAKNVNPQLTKANGSAVQSKKKTVMQNAVGVKRGKAIPINEAATGANPHYNDGWSYHINCQRCVQAYELRRRGYNVTAMPKPQSGNTVFWGSECFNGFGASQFDAMRAYTHNQTEAAVKKELASAPDGARYSIYIRWKRSHSAHVFIAEKQNGIIRYIDPQDGTMDASGYFANGSRGKFGFFRMDDKPLTTDESIIKTTVEKGGTP